MASKNSIAAYNAAQAKKNVVTQGTYTPGLTLSPIGNIGIASQILNSGNQNNYKDLYDAQNQKLLGLQSQLGDITNQLNQQNDIKAQINALNQAKQAQAIADLGKARDNQLANLDTQQASITPLYNTKRNVAAATNMAGRRTLAEELAARGEANSGVSDQANINANMSLQNDLGTLNAQEASNLADIANQRTGIQNAYQSDVASAKAGLDAAAMQNLINQYNTDRNYKLQEAGVTGTYNGAQTQDALNAARNFALNQAGVTGTYNGSPTLEAQNQAYNQDLQTKQYNQQVQQQKLDNLYRQQTFNYQKARDAVTDSQWQQQMNLDLRKESYSEAQQKIQNALNARQISQTDASQALEWAKFNADQDPNSLDNQLKKQQVDANAQSKSSAQLNSLIDNYNNLYVTKTYDKGKGTTTSTPDKKGILDSLKASVQSGKMSEDIARQVAAYYGISM